ERERALLYSPTSVRVGVEWGQTSLVFLVVMAYSVVAPLVSLLGLAFFVMGWVSWRYSLLYIFIRQYESGGLMWPWFVKRMLVIFAIFGLFTSCVFVVKRAFTQAVLLLVLVPIILVRFNNFLFYRFQRATQHVPLRLAQQAPPARVDPQAYIPAPLQPHSLGWTPDWCKPWQGWNLPTGYSVSNLEALRYIQSVAPTPLCKGGGRVHFTAHSILQLRN
ncbi:hypothetical protein QJQ45_014057, partial [Haematococcus lacustris]